MLQCAFNLNYIKRWKTPRNRGSTHFILWFVSLVSLQFCFSFIFVFVCRVAMDNWCLVQGVTLPLSYDSYERLQQTSGTPQEFGKKQALKIDGWIDWCLPCHSPYTETHSNKRREEKKSSCETLPATKNKRVLMRHQVWCEWRLTHFLERK